MVETFSFNGLPAIRWTSADGARAIATLQGAHLVSWIPAGGEECLFVSGRSPFEPGRAIRGGIPVVFPQFAERGALPKHGFARTREWSFVDAAEEGGVARVSFALEIAPGRLELTARIGGPRLDVDLNVVNAGRDAYPFAAALHTYFRISDNAAVRLEGLREGSFTFADPIDRIFFGSPSSTRLVDAGRTFRIEQHGFFDTVVWNPGRELTATMADMPPEGYRHMLCVEAAAIEPAVRLAPGTDWRGGQAIEVL